MDDAIKVASLCEERAASYGALRQSSLTAIALDRAANLLRHRAEAPASASEGDVERVTRAICAEDGEPRDDGRGVDAAGWWKMYERHARAAIAALRSPPHSDLRTLVGYEFGREEAIRECAAAAHERLMPTNDRSDWTEFAHTRAEAADQTRRAILALLPAEPQTEQSK